MFELTLLVLKYAFLIFLYFFVILIVRLVYLDLYHKKTAHSGPQIIMLDGPGQQAGQNYTLGRELKIGRDAQNEIVLDDDYSSGLHARVYKRGNKVYVEDMGSTNGTFVKEKRIAKPVTLRPGDRIRIGQTVLGFER